MDHSVTSTRACWEEFASALSRQRPDLLTRAQVRALPAAARAEGDSG